MLKSLNLNKIKVIKALKDIDNWFNSTDWIPNKIVTGEWDRSDKRWLDYLIEREKKRKIQDKLKAIISDRKVR